MAYERDRDAATRGVGAIAARDYGNRARMAQRKAIARRTAARDRAMSGMTMRPGGGLGAVNFQSIRYGSQSQGVVPGSIQLPGGGGSVMPPKPSIATSMFGRATVASSYAGQQPMPILGIYAPASPPSSLSSGTMPLPLPLPPVVTPPVVTPDPGATTGTTVTGGSGGGSGVTSGGGGGDGSASIDPLPDMPDVTVTANDNTTRNLLIAGGVIAAAYLLFGRKKNGGQP